MDQIQILCKINGTLLKLETHLIIIIEQPKPISILQLKTEVTIKALLTHTQGLIRQDKRGGAGQASIRRTCSLCCHCRRPTKGW